MQIPENDYEKNVYRGCSITLPLTRSLRAVSWTRILV
eukprot:UN06469